METKPLTPAELKLMADVLELAGDQFSNHGCNDFEIDDTPEHRAIVAEMHKDDPGFDIEDFLYHGKINAGDDSLMSHFADRCSALARASS